MEVVLFVEVSVALLALRYELRSEDFHILHLLCLGHFLGIGLTGNHQAVVTRLALDSGSHLLTQGFKLVLLLHWRHVDADDLVVEVPHLDGFGKPFVLFDPLFNLYLALGLNPRHVDILEDSLAFVEVYLAVLTRLHVQTHAVTVLVDVMTFLLLLLLAESQGTIQLVVIIHSLQLTPDIILSCGLSLSENFLLGPNSHR
jgi:hypothetical protein